MKISRIRVKICNKFPDPGRYFLHLIYPDPGYSLTVFISIIFWNYYAATIVATNATNICKHIFATLLQTFDIFAMMLQTFDTFATLLRCYKLSKIATNTFVKGAVSCYFLGHKFM